VPQLVRFSLSQSKAPPKVGEVSSSTLPIPAVIEAQDVPL
ncbi:uncharacterized protein METZ01_LOCUS260079, partial [marine metagenome]